MTEELKEVKVDNWGIYFLQRLKHFFNRTDYCDLTLQFQDNAQLKVHRLVLNACTEYFELLERTCEMYEDCLVMPDDLQADVVVPIINFMYTGHLEFKFELLERLYQTSLVMNMPVLSKLLAAHRHQNRPVAVHSYSKKLDFNKVSSKVPVPSSSGTNKRTFSKAFVDLSDAPASKKAHHSSYSLKTEKELINGMPNSETSSFNYSHALQRNKNMSEPRPTRYELPEELDEDNIFGNSFTSVSYTSKPLMVHPETVKQYGARKGGLFEDSSTSKRFFRTPSTVDIVECKKVSNSNIFEDEISESVVDENEIFQQCSYNKDEGKDASQLFDQILDNDGPKLTIEAKDSKQASNIDHAKIISEVLKKYPHLVKSNKNIKLKILSTSKTKKKGSYEEKDNKQKQVMSDFTYESDVIDSKEAARLIALGAENVKGPWICLICGTPGRALHFTTYYKFRRHLVTVHNEKPVANICEYCGLKSQKRNYLLHHLYTKHGIEPPPNYHFPKCSVCNYVALTEAFLVKHKVSHMEYRSFRCNVCAATFPSSSLLLSHIQKTGHKYSADRKANLQCIYCLKVFLRESNLYAHLKTTHKNSAKTDGIIDDSDEERIDEEENLRSKSEVKNSMNVIKVEVPTYDSFNECSSLMPYQIEQSSSSNMQITPKKPRILLPQNNKLKILNSGLNTQISTVSSKATELKQQQKKIHQEQPPSNQNQFLEVMDATSQIDNQSEIVLIDNNEYIIQNYQLIPKKERSTEEYVLHNTMNNALSDPISTLAPSSSIDFHGMGNAQPETSKMIGKKTATLSQPIQIVVSNEEEYKALMSSNHSIIFDSTNSNKALAVLTTPDGTPIQTNSIDLHGGQTNDVMIIPDSYPINVSETVSADNSNILVVYSHSVVDQNKQFQLIRSQGIEAQFDTPTMITQNYETVVTSTPIMSAHVLNAPVESWHSNISRNISKLPIPCGTEIQTMAAPMQVATIENMSSNHLEEELPNVQVTGNESLPANIIQNTTEHTDNSTSFYNHPNVQNPVEEQSEMNSMCGRISSNSMSNEEQQSIINTVEVLENTGTISEVISAPNIDVDVNNINTLNQCNINNVNNNADMSLHQMAEANNIILVENNPCSIISNNFIVQNEQIISSACETPISNCSQEISVHTTNVEQVNTNIVRETEMEVTVSEDSQNNVCDAQQAIVIYENVENITRDTNTQTISLHENTAIAFQNESVKIEHDQISQTGVDNCDHVGKNDNISSEGHIVVQAEEMIQPKLIDTVVPQISDNVAPQISDNVEPQITENIEPQVSDNIERQINDNIQPQISANIEHPISDNVQPQINDNIETQKNDNVEPQIKYNVEPQINKRLDADENAQTILDEHVQPEINKNLGVEKIDTIKKEVGEHVVKLASEWSDDENESTQPPKIDQCQNRGDELDTSNAEQSEELEETIENIAQEMKKQGAIEMKCNVHTNVSEQLNLTGQVKTGSDVVKEVKKVSQEKISSLLNDWDDNESQGDNEKEESPVDENKEPTEKINKPMNQNVNTGESVPTEKDNKIKSLVSDWDEEEEETKE